jgi:hypothetical protein
MLIFYRYRQIKKRDNPSISQLPDDPNFHNIEAIVDSILVEGVQSNACLQLDNCNGRSSFGINSVHACELMAHHNERFKTDSETMTPSASTLYHDEAVESSTAACFSPHASIPVHLHISINPCDRLALVLISIDLGTSLKFVALQKFKTHKHVYFGMW